MVVYCPNCKNDDELTLMEIYKKKKGKYYYWYTLCEECGERFYDENSKEDIEYDEDLINQIMPQ